MKWFPQDIWKYAVLLVLLFAIAAIAARETIAYIEDLFPAEEFQHAVQYTSWAIWLLTFGFMFLTGAFGLWAIRTITEAESNRRISRLVDAMDYLSDAIFAVDQRGRVTGSNPAARSLVGGDFAERLRFRDLFPAISAADLQMLLNTGPPKEVERDRLTPDGLSTLRFRSEPTDGPKLILVSDVTETKAQMMRDRQVAQLRLIGRIARGVAYDFNDILCSIIGHADLLKRLDTNAGETVGVHIAEISRTAEKGAALAERLQRLSQLGPLGTPTERVSEHVRRSAELLRVGLAEGWQVEITTESDLPAVSLSDAQIERVVLTLGLLAADSAPAPGVVQISLSKPGHDHLTAVEHTFAGVLIVSATAGPDDSSPRTHTDSGFSLADTTSADGGVILSVVHSIVAEAGGRLDMLHSTTGQTMYRLCLPYSDASTKQLATLLSQELQEFVRGASALFARRKGIRLDLEQSLRDMGGRVESVDNIVSTLARVQAGEPLDVMIIEKRVLGQEADGLLKAIVKLCPATGIVVLSEEPDDEPELPHVTFESEHAGSDRIVGAMFEIATATAKASASSTA